MLAQYRESGHQTIGYSAIEGSVTTWKVIASKGELEEDRSNKRTTPAKGKNACSRS
jgi:hypothetical protein